MTQLFAAAAVTLILICMDDIPHHRPPTDRNLPMPSKSKPFAALSESEAKAEAGLFVSGGEIMRELSESIARMERQVASADDANVDRGSSPRR